MSAVQPVINPIQRICQTTIGHPERINKLLEGAIIPLRRVVIACGQDSFLAEGIARDGNPPSARQVLETLPSDVIAASLVLYSVDRRLRGRLIESVGEAFLNEALVRAAMGFVVGDGLDRFGRGRSMLAGFSSRAGLAMIVSEGTEAQAAELINQIEVSDSLQRACVSVYEVDPLHVGALVLLAAGCGMTAYSGILGCSTSHSAPPSGDAEILWWAVHLLIDQVATKSFEEIPEIVWETLGFTDLPERQDIYNVMHGVSAREYRWSWLL